MATTGLCECRSGLVLGANGHCNDPNWDDLGESGGGGGGGGGGGSGGGGGGGNTGNNDDDDRDPDAFSVSLICAPAEVKRGQRVDCDATARNAKGEVTYTWRFIPKNGGVDVWPVGDPVDLPEVHDTTKSSNWGGAGGGKRPGGGSGD